ncbi:hypothetical protein [Mycobacterium sp.]|uniref:hypothetical protein n=1 Tax=Mycobacterium sp. TaxID=1785 RepID=UPI003F97F235
MKYAMEYREGSYRYSWRDIDGGAEHPAYADQPAYVVTEADWLALVEKFGLSRRIVDDYASGNIARRNQRAMIRALAWFALFLLLLSLSAYLKYGR